MTYKNIIFLYIILIKSKIDNKPQNLDAIIAFGLFGAQITYKFTKSETLEVMSSCLKTYKKI